MKIVYTFLLSMLIGITSVNAQKMGLKGGLNFLNVSSKDDVMLSTSRGFHLGVAFETSLLPLVDVGTGLFYTRRGYQSNITGREGNAYIDYIDLPIDAIFKISALNMVGAFVSVGPYFSYGVSSQVVDELGDFADGYKNDNIDLNRIDSGINIGAGVNITNLRISAAYGISLTDNGSIADNELKNRVLKISLGYFFF